MENKFSLFWQNSEAVQRKTCLGTESGGIGVIGKAVVYSLLHSSFLFSSLLAFKPLLCSL